MVRVILHVDIDSFFASAEVVRNPSLSGKAVVVCVYSGRTADSGAVSTANYAARELGIHAGMTIYAAKKKTLGRDDVVFLPVDKDYYSSVSGRVMEILEEDADAFEQASIDEAYIDVGLRVSGSFDEAARLALLLKKRVFEAEGLTCSVGVGYNKLSAKMASKHKKPDGLTVVRPGGYLALFGGLPVSKLHGVGKVGASLLDGVGIMTVSELAAADILVLSDVLGANKARLYLDKARGVDESPVEAREKKQLSRIGTLAADSSDHDFVFAKVKELSFGLSSKVASRGVLFRTVTLITIDTHLEMQTKSETVSPTGDISVALDVAKGLISEFFSEFPGRELRRVGIRVSNFVVVGKGGQKRLGDF